MPFTLCHPALIIPLNWYARRQTSLAALVIGSTMPDLVYFYPFAAHGGFTHSLPGVFAYCVPAGVLVYILYYGLMRDALLEWAPGAISARMDPVVPWRPRNLRDLGVILVSLALGAMSHIAWDAFTHANTVVVNYAAVLRSPVALGTVEVPLFKVLQHLSSLIGFLAIASYAAYWFFSTPPRLPSGRQWSITQRLYVLLAVGAAFTAGGVAGLLLRSARTIERGMFNFIVSAMAAAGVAILLLCVLRKIRSGTGS